MEQLELDAHRSEIVEDISRLVEKYRRIFGLDIPEIDQHAADELILAEMHTSLDEIATKLVG
jgi:hypothetical protein